MSIVNLTVLINGPVCDKAIISSNELSILPHATPVLNADIFKGILPTVLYIASYFPLEILISSLTISSLVIRIWKICACFFFNGYYTLL